MAERAESIGDSKGFGLSLLDRIQNEGSIHHEVVRAVETITRRNLIAYTSFLRHPAASIVQEDSQLIEHLLRSVDLSHYPDTLDLLLPYSRWRSDGGGADRLDVSIVCHIPAGHRRAECNECGNARGHGSG